MSVSAATSPEIDLFIPQPPLGSDRPIGKWRGAAQVSGDATAGTVTLDITSATPAAASLYMWSIEDFQVTDSPGPAAGHYGVLEWETGDPVVIAGVSVVFTLRTSIQLLPPSVATINGAAYYELKAWRYVARPRGFNIRWRIQIGNTNLHIYQFEAWGFLWNQEYAKYGPVSRPT